MDKETLPKIQWIKLSKLRLNPDNPRFIRDEPFQRLVKSMREKPHFIKYKHLIVDDSQGNLILAGNQRWRAAKELGWDKIACVFTSDLTEEEKEQLMVKDNAHYGEHDFNMLSSKWDAETLEILNMAILSR